MRPPHAFLLSLLLTLLLTPLGWVSPVRADGIGGVGTSAVAPPGPETRPCTGCGCEGANTPGANGTGKGEPVWTYDGSWYVRYTDLTVGVNFPIQLTRRYDNRSEYDSAVGYGWSHNYDSKRLTNPTLYFVAISD